MLNPNSHQQIQTLKILSQWVLQNVLKSFNFMVVQNYWVKNKAVFKSFIGNKQPTWNKLAMLSTSWLSQDLS